MKSWRCAVMLSMVVFCSAAFGLNTTGLEAYWSFDEGTGPVAHDSADAHDGNLVGGPAWVDGPWGPSALEFDGSNYVSVEHDPALSFSKDDSFTISCWVNPTSPTNAGNIVGKYRAGGSGVFGYRVGWQASTSAFVFILEKSGIGYISLDTGDNSVVTGTWYHVTAVYDQGDASLYLNGGTADNDTFGYNTGSTKPDNNLTIGARAYNDIVDQYLRGKVDEVLIFSRALSETEVGELYTIPEPATIVMLGFGIC